MALTAFDRAGERPPISQHRAFPAIVALWFAALLGFGSMVVPAALLERGVALTGIAEFVSAANPPLGFTARALIALVAAVVGAAAGLAIARRVARAHDSDSLSQDNTYANGARRPLDITAELGGEGLGSGFGQPVTRRRALAIAEDDKPSDALYLIPVPGAEHVDPTAAYDEAISPDAVDGPFDGYEAAETPIDAWHSPEIAVPANEPISVAQDYVPLPPEPDAGSQHEGEPVPGEPEAEPLAFAAPSLGRRSEAHALPIAPASATDEPELVQLVHRLKSSLERRRELADAPTVGKSDVEVGPAAPPRVPPTDFEPAPADDAALAMAAYFGRPAPPPAAELVAEDGEEESDDSDGSYSSLLAMRGPYTPRGNARVPVEMPEAEDEARAVAETEVHAELAEPEVQIDTDAALRTALAKLQRMSGTA